MISGTLLGCSTARNKGTCENRTNMRREELERRVLNALRQYLMDPELFAEFCNAFTSEMNRLRMEASADNNTHVFNDGRNNGMFTFGGDAMIGF